MIQLQEKLEVTSKDLCERLLSLEQKWQVQDHELRQCLFEFETKHVQQQLTLTQSLEKAYTLTNGLKDELDLSIANQFAKESKGIAEFRDQVELQLTAYSR